jgi:hypothetical protein
VSRSARGAAPSLRARARPDDDGDDSITLTLFLEPDEAAGPICVALRAIDGVGRRSEDSPESCFDPGAAERSVFASSCAARPRPARTPGGDALAGALLLSVAVLLGRRARTGRRARARDRRNGARA